MENHFIRISFPSEDDLTLDFRFEIHSWQEREREREMFFKKCLENSKKCVLL